MKIREVLEACVTDTAEKEKRMILVQKNGKKKAYMEIRELDKLEVHRAAALPRRPTRQVLLGRVALRGVVEEVESVPLPQKKSTKSTNQPTNQPRE